MKMINAAFAGLFVLIVLASGAGAVNLGPAAKIGGYAYLDGSPAAGALVKMYSSSDVMIGNVYTNDDGLFMPVSINTDDLTEGELITFTINNYEANGSVEYHSDMGTSIVDIYATSIDCPLSEQLSVETDSASYLRDEDVTISGVLKDEYCNAASEKNVALQVKNPEGTTVVVEQATTNENGEYSYTFTLADDAALGTYSVSAAALGLTSETTFDVNSDESNESNDCTENWTCTGWSMCMPDNQSVRICIDLNECGTENDKPNVTQNCSFEMPENCSGEVYVSVESDKPYYEGTLVENAVIFGYVLNDCQASGNVPVEISAVNGEYVLFNETLTTDSNGIFSHLFDLNASNDPYGLYDVFAKNGEANGSSSFYYVQACDSDGDGHNRVECGGDDCKDSDAAVYPGASCSSGCENTGATYNSNCECAGGSNTCSTGGGTTTTGWSGGYSGGGGGAPPAGEEENECVPDWKCTDWSPAECPETGVQTRTCVDENGCDVAEEDHPDVLRNCEYTGSVCGNDICEDDETCSTCEADCGACPVAPTGTICGNDICEDDETCSTCEADCGACPSEESGVDANAGPAGLAGLIPGGTASLGGIAILIVVLAVLGYAYKKRPTKK